jgi:hypothetical protein
MGLHGMPSYDVTRTLPHIPVQEVPISVEWYVHRNRNVPARVNRFLAVAPTGRDLWNDQFPPYAITSWNLLTPRHFTTPPRATDTAVGDQRVPMPRTSTGRACAAGTNGTSSMHAQDTITSARVHRNLNIA